MADFQTEMTQKLRAGGEEGIRIFLGMSKLVRKNSGNQGIAEWVKVGYPALPVSTANPTRLTPACESDDISPDGRSLQVDLVSHCRAVPVAGSIAGRDSHPSTSAQCAASSIGEAPGLHQYRPPGVCGTLWSDAECAGSVETPQAGNGDPLGSRGLSSLLALEVPTSRRAAKGIG